jgi:hypothetical protein
MARWILVANRTRESHPLARARWCDSFACRLRGLSLRRRLSEGEGLLLVEARPSRLGAAIHMAGMLFPLGIVWIGPDQRVVDLVRALPWRIYWPATPAIYTLEASPDILDSVAAGDHVEFIDEPPG